MRVVEYDGDPVGDPVAPVILDAAQSILGNMRREFRQVDPRSVVEVYIEVVRLDILPLEIPILHLVLAELLRLHRSRLEQQHSASQQDSGHYREESTSDRVGSGHVHPGRNSMLRIECGGSPLKVRRERLRVIVSEAVRISYRHDEYAPKRRHPELVEG